MKRHIIFVVFLFCYSNFGFSQDNVFPLNGNVGIGTTTPQSKLHVDFYNGDNPTYGLTLSLLSFHTSPTANASYYLKMIDQGSNNTTFIVRGNGNMGLGVDDPKSKLDVNGDIRARKIKVTQSGWPDFVFHPSYELLPLPDLKAFLKKNHHLPDVPSEAEIIANGQDLGEMNKILLQKIEELTLYIIAQEEKIENIEAKNERMEEMAAEIKRIKEQLKALLENKN